jgi:hypothetical protein
VIDLGLGPEELEWTKRHADEVEPGRWDVDFPDRDRAPRFQQGYTCRPFLPNYFPGHDVYIWIDADAWIQDWAAIELFESAASSGSIGIVPQIDRAYSLHYESWHDQRWKYRNFLDAFGEDAADVLSWSPTLNAGLFSMRGDSAGWAGWADLLERGIQRTLDVVDQTALNVLIYAGGLDAQYLPSTCNWMCMFASPALDSSASRLVHPMLPHETLGVVHLAGIEPKSGPATLLTADGRRETRWLTFQGEPR